MALPAFPPPGKHEGTLQPVVRASGVNSARDRFICEQVGPILVEKGLNFVGLDVIGEYLTEINVTCPTCIRELNQQFDLDIAGDYIDFVAAEIG